MSLQNGETISTGQVVKYKNAGNVCQQHCLDTKDNYVCGKGELCCNKQEKIRDNLLENINGIFSTKKTND